MAKMCPIAGKKLSTGNTVSHSERKARRTFAPNLHRKRLLNPATGKMVIVTLSTAALRTLAKWDAEGRVYDLKKLAGK